MTSLLKTLVVRDLATDAQLLGRFVRDRDDAAFTELVRRHGPLVLGVCRRVIPDRDLADDAFQAAFVVLARKAESVQPADKLASWLYGVSYKVALRARTMAGRRAKHETLTATLPETPVPPDAIDELGSVLDAEIANLPVLYRDAVVLCELQGVSRHDAAMKLGIMEGTLSSRLAKARKLLAVALARRGVAMPATLAVTTTVTLELCTATVRAATGTLAPPLVSTLANGVLRMMMLSKLKLTAVVGICAALLLGLGVGSVTRPEVAIAAPVPKAEKDEGLLWLHDTKAKKLIAYAPDGKMHQEIDLPEGDRFIKFTADGTKILFAGKGGKVADADVTEGLTLHLRSDFAKPEGIDTGLGYQPNDQFDADGRHIQPYDQYAVSPDGKQIVRQRMEKVQNVKFIFKFSHVLFDVATKKETKIDLPDDHQLMQWSADGKTWRIFKNVTEQWLSMPVGGGGKLTPINNSGSLTWLDPSPDGKTFLATGSKRDRLDFFSEAVFHVDAPSGKTIEFKAFDEGVAYLHARWSPDGHRIGCMKYNCDSLNNLGDSHLLLFDADGKNEKTLLSIKDDRQKTRFLGWYPTRVAAKRIAPVKQPAVVEPGAIWTFNYKSGLLASYTPDGKTLKQLTLKDGKNFRRMTPDGQKIAFIGRNGQLAEEGAKDGTLHIRDVNDSTEGEDLGLGYQERNTFEWSPDRKQIVRERRQGEGGNLITSWVLFDVATKKETTFDSAGFEMGQWLDDGKLYFYEAMRNDPRYPTLPRLRKWKMSVVGGKPTILCENASLWWLASVGDGSYIGLGRLHENPKNESEYVVYRRWLRIDNKGEASVVKTFDEFEHVGLKLSPDRKQVACMGQTRGTDPDRTGNSTLLLYDLDGKNERQILTLPNDDKQTQMLGWFPTAK